MWKYERGGPRGLWKYCSVV